MSKETSYTGMSFRVRFVSANGRLLGHLEWSTERDAVCHLTDTINSKRIGISAFVETKGSKHASPQGSL